MATPRPKQFTAARPFSSRGRWYQTGEPVTDRRTIARLIPHGDKYIVWKAAKAAPAEPTADPIGDKSEEDT